MAGICAAFADASKLERTIGISRQVQEVTEIMNGSINEMLATQDDLQVLEDKTDALASQAQNFQRSARRFSAVDAIPVSRYLCAAADARPCLALGCAV